MIRETLGEDLQGFARIWERICDDIKLKFIILFYISKMRCKRGILKG